MNDTPISASQTSSVKMDPLRVLFVGDSYTFGFLVKENEAFPRVLGERYLPEAFIINLAVPGYGNDQQLLRYEYEGSEWKADLVILGFYTRDLYRNPLSFNSYAKPTFQIQDDTLELADDEIINPTELLAEYQSGEKIIRASGSYLIHYILQQINKYDRRHINIKSPEWVLGEKILDRFVNRVRQDGACPIILIIPNKDILENETSATTEIIDLLNEYGKDRGVLNLDMTPHLRQAQKADKEPLYQGHFSPRGHALTAQCLNDFLKKNGLLEYHNPKR
jgi:hypothetical protein